MSQKQVKRERRKKRLTTPVGLPKDIPVPSNGGPVNLPLATGKITVKVPGELAQQILDYIQTRPYNEVHLLIGGLMRCEKLKE